MRLLISNVGPGPAICHITREDGTEQSITMPAGERHNISCIALSAYDEATRVVTTHEAVSPVPPANLLGQNDGGNDEPVEPAPKAQASGQGGENAPAPSVMNGLVGNGSIGG